MSSDFQVSGKNPQALFTLKVHRGDGMALLAMDWKNGTPSDDFVGFAIEYREPLGDRFYALKNRLSFPGPGGHVQKKRLSTLLSPIQKFRWIHFPRNAELPGKFTYRVSPVFMNALDELSYGEPQEVAIELNRETYAGKVNVTFTRGFVSSQAFVDRYATEADSMKKLLPAKADDGLDFVPTHPKASEALTWMGFEARRAIYETLDEALAEGAEVRIVAYDLSEREFQSKLEALGNRLRIIIDDSEPHGNAHSAETAAAARLQASNAQVRRQHVGNLQHNKTIVVDGPNVKKVVCGSTNFSWRGFFVQANNALILTGQEAVSLFSEAFEDYWTSGDSVTSFAKTPSATLRVLRIPGLDIKVASSPHSTANALLQTVADDIASAKSSVLYSMAFLYQTQGSVRQAIEKVTKDESIFVYGISDKKVGGFDLLKPDGNRAPVRAEALAKEVPEPFKSEPTGGMGTRIHHKFVVIDFDKPTARTYLGSYNFSHAADRKNGENLVVIRDRKMTVAYMIEALRLFDHYHFRVALKEAKQKHRRLLLKKPPREAGEETWWLEDFTDPRKIKDRLLFA
jgi:phosphatidylserine/phosphatidylglycerophosphate/cardiolipin synthase-like enzyme